MTKVFQVLNGFCYWQAPYQSLEETTDKFAPNIYFVEAPDYVFEGWGYLNGEFIKPKAPEGFIYDDETGTFYAEADQSAIFNERYEMLAQEKIRERYTATDEYKVLREKLAGRDGSEEQFNEYNQYVEQCKAEAYLEIYGEDGGNNDEQV